MCVGVILQISLMNSRSMSPTVYCRMLCHECVHSDETEDSHRTGSERIVLLDQFKYWMQCKQEYTFMMDIPAAC